MAEARSADTLLVIERDLLLARMHSGSQPEEEVEAGEDEALWNKAVRAAEASRSLGDRRASLADNSQLSVQRSLALDMGTLPEALDVGAEY